MNARDHEHLIPTAPNPNELDYDGRVEARLIRIETRLVLLMRRMGLDANGKHINDQEQPT